PAESITGGQPTDPGAVSEPGRISGLEGPASPHPEPVPALRPAAESRFLPDRPALRQRPAQAVADGLPAADLPARPGSERGSHGARVGDAAGRPPRQPADRTDPVATILARPIPDAPRGHGYGPQRGADREG